MYIDIGDYKYVVLERAEALRLMTKIKNEKGSTRDLEEAIRIVENFEEYYRYQVRRAQSYIVIPKDTRDLIIGRAVVDKLRLSRKEGKELVEIVFDRRVDTGCILKMLGEMGYTDVSIGEKA
uniref:Uncharacterized protein n=1 Tax=Fervidicoccus fontis TaxID=683846 RepID=A0A7J3ZKR4_9CREN